MNELGKDTDSIGNLFYTKHTLYNIEPKSENMLKIIFNRKTA